MATSDDKRSSYPTAHEDQEGKGYNELAEDTLKPVIMMARVIVNEAPEIKKPELKPDIVLTTEVIWGPLPQEPPPKPNRVATTPRTQLMERRGPGPKKAPSIGSMDPHRGRK